MHSFAEFSEEKRISKSRVYQLAEGGRLRTRRFGKMRGITTQEFKRWVVQKKDGRTKLVRL